MNCCSHCLVWVEKLTKLFSLMLLVTSQCSGLHIFLICERSPVRAQEGSLCCVRKGIWCVRSVCNVHLQYISCFGFPTRSTQGQAAQVLYIRQLVLELIISIFNPSNFMFGSSVAALAFPILCFTTFQALRWLTVVKVPCYHATLDNLSSCIWMVSNSTIWTAAGGPKSLFCSWEYKSFAFVFVMFWIWLLVHCGVCCILLPKAHVFSPNFSFSVLCFSVAVQWEPWLPQQLSSPIFGFLTMHFTPNTKGFFF